MYTRPLTGEPRHRINRRMFEYKAIRVVRSASEASLHCSSRISRASRRIHAARAGSQQWKLRRDPTLSDINPRHAVSNTSVANVLVLCILRRIPRTPIAYYSIFLIK
ncbi:hypothetical protein BV25DRAFT_1040577 [Artomyces pyxidatus]|uniref:Uncharacterized protein n=1 Tax=Artomyces pyxidatus TaxID=48021 RepID=A0ACB8STW3_9AGAM|nr:hypothetical protein BV25DRAFT_1040577 [Artomyces pyxidatus]